MRASRAAVDGDPFPQLKKMFETVAMAKVSGSALEAKQLGLLREDDVVVFNAFELLYVAKQVAGSLAESGWRPPLPARDIIAAGDVGTASLKMMLVNMLEGRFISEHDYEIASRIADTMCGGDDRARIAHRRAMAARSGAQAFRRAGADGEDAGSHCAHDEHGQAAEELDPVVPAKAGTHFDLRP